MKKLKKRPGAPGKRIVPSFEAKPYPQFKHPVFCFKYLNKKFGLENCNKEEKAALIDQLSRLSQMTWTDIKMAPRHGCGSEKINQNALKTKVPLHLSKDVDLYALRFMGKKFLSVTGPILFFIFFILIRNSFFIPISK